MRVSVLGIAAFLAILLFVPVAAQDYDCTKTTGTGTFSLDCTERATATPTRVFPTPTSEPTATSTSTNTPVPTATSTSTNTPVPPTATATTAATSTSAPTATSTSTKVPPTATATSTATSIPPTATSVPQPVSALRVNVPLLNVVSGDPGLDANNRAIVWAGKIADDGNYFQSRIVGSDSGLHLYSQQMRRRPQTGERLTITLNGKEYTTAYKQPGNWTQSERCGDGECRGWAASILIPWSELGGKPALGDEWALVASHLGAEWKGVLQWGERSNYAGSVPANATVLRIPLNADSTLGGSTDCGGWAWPEHFPLWGDVNLTDLAVYDWWETSPFAQTRGPNFDPKQYNYLWSVQNQWDTADWPCYSRYIAKLNLPKLPAGAVVTGAWMDAYKFGHSGYLNENTGINVIQAWEVSPDWQEGSVTWNNAPLAIEAVSRTPVGECAADFCEPGDWHSFDISEIVRRAYKAGNPQASFVLYSGAGQYHSGRYFDSREGGAPPVIRVAYVLDGQATATATMVPPTATVVPPTATIVPPTATKVPPTSTPVPTVAATATALPTATAVVTRQPTATPISGSGKTIYASPSDNLALKVAQLNPGDTLVLRDGVYRQSLIPTVSGTAQQRIRIIAEHDGQAIIDGENRRSVVETGHSRPGTGDYITFEGIVGRNSSEDVWFIRSNGVILRRVSGYNASVDDNSSVFTFWTRGGGLLEDCIASGTGRKMILLYQSDNVTVRRCFTRWQQWDGRDFCGVLWPNAETVQVYNGNGNTFENVIVTGPSPVWLIAVQSNSDAAVANNNKVLGSIAVGAGMNAAGSAYNYGTRPQPTTCGDTIRSFDWPNQRAGVMLWGQGTMQNNTFRDILTTGNAALGFSYDRPYGVGATGTVVDRLTAYGNGAYAPAGDGGKGAQVKLNGIVPTNSCIGSPTCAAGGARLTQRYIDGVLTSIPLWPFPMDGRAESELGINITQWAAPYVNR